MAETVLAHMAAQLVEGSTAGPDGVQLRELPSLAKINLRGNLGDARFRNGVRHALSLDLPATANTFTRRGEMRCLWLGPDEWLVLVPPADAEASMDRLRTALSGEHASIVDVGASYATLELAGGRAREVLAKACSLDLHPRVFRPGQCAQSNFARTQGILTLEDDLPVFRLFVRKSFAEYLADWLLDAMAEYRVGSREQ